MDRLADTKPLLPDPTPEIDRVATQAARLRRVGENQQALALWIQLADGLETQGWLVFALDIWREQILPSYALGPASVGESVVMRAQADALLRIADLLASLGRFDQAASVLADELLPRARQIHDAKLTALVVVRLADAYLTQGLVDLAEQVLLNEQLPDRATVDLSPEDGALWMKLAQVRIAQARSAGEGRMGRGVGEGREYPIDTVLAMLRDSMPSSLRGPARDLFVDLARLCRTHAQVDTALALYEQIWMPRLDSEHDSSSALGAAQAAADLYLVRGQGTDRARADRLLRRIVSSAYEDSAVEIPHEPSEDAPLIVKTAHERMKLAGLISPLPLTSLRIENFRGISDVKLTLHPRVTVFYGRNASGKTTVLDAVAKALAPLMEVCGQSERSPLTEQDIRVRWAARPPAVAASARITAESPIASWDVTVLRDQASTLRSEGEMPIGKQLLHDRISARITALLDQPDGIDLVPVVAYYGTERAVTSEVLMRVDWLPDIRSPRLKSLAGALDARTQFGDTFSWFRSLLERESQARMERGELIYQLPEAQAVRQALERALPGCTNPRIDLDPPRFMIDFRRGEAVEVLHLGQLSDGYRIYLALVMDLARRMLQANPPPQPPHTRTFGLEAPALVLIDEIDLHLHPRWQQTVVPPLLDIFPRTQFLITTHSEQVLSSLPSDALVLELEQQGDGLRITQPALRLHGALAEQVLEQVLDVPPRPPSQYSTDLARYLELIDQGQGEMPEALALRSKLEPIRPDDPDLTRADLRIQRQKLFANKPRRPDAPPKQGKS